MNDCFEISGNHIKYADIKDFKIVQREYIYRPFYKETEGFSLKRTFGKKYEFAGMQPYAAICGESAYTSAVQTYEAKGLKDSIGKDVFEGVVTTIGDKFNIKALRAKKYNCINQAGRKFAIYLEDIPAVLVRRDGKVSDVQKNDELYHLLGEPIAPTINMIEALLIKAKEDYLFYGAGIHVDDAMAVYQRLGYEMSIYEESKKGSRKIELPKFTMPMLKEKNPLMQILNLNKKESAAEIPRIDKEQEVIDVEFNVQDNE